VILKIRIIILKSDSIEQDSSKEQKLKALCRVKNISSINAVKIKAHLKEGGERKGEVGQKFVILTYKNSKKK